MLWIILGVPIALGALDWAVRGNSRRGPSRLAVILLILFFSVVSGFRTSFNDTHRYLASFSEIISGPNAGAAISWDLADNPGFWLLVSTILRVWPDPQAALLIISAVTVSLYVGFFARYSERFWLTVYLFVASGHFFFTFAGVKQALAMAIGLVGIHYVIQRRSWHAVFLIILAATVHPFVLMYLLAFSMGLDPFRRGLLLFGGGGLIGGLFFDRFAAASVVIAGWLGAEYTAAELEGGGVNVMRLVVHVIPVLLAVALRTYIRPGLTRASTIFLNMAIVNAALLFVARYGDPILLGRLAVYFEPALYLVLPLVLVSVQTRWSREVSLLLSTLVVAGYGAYCVASSVLLSSFEARYEIMSASEALRLLGLGS